MTVNVNVLLAFCEGPHDVAYTRLALRKLLNFEKIEVPFKELPSPFHHLFKQSVATHAAKELSLDMAHKFFLPDTVLRRDNHLVFIFNSGGCKQYDKLNELLSDYLIIFPQAKTFAQGAQEIVDTVRYLFLYDADAEGLNALIYNFTSRFAVVDSKPFITEEWSISSKSPFGRIAGDKSLYVWGEQPEQGTLEDNLIPMFMQDQAALMIKAENAIDSMFTWDIFNSNPKMAVPNIAKRKKAIVTAVGQGNKSGSSMNVIIEQSKLLSDETIKKDIKIKGLTDFIAEFIGLTV